MKTPSVKSPLTDLRRRLPGLMPRDRHRLRRRIDGAEKIRDPDRRRSVAAEISADIDTCEARVERRRSASPAVDYPPELPVSQKKDDILAAVRDHQVVVVAGETGSGKTTQLPKICLELGRGVLGQIGHTQPRRLAARTVAERIAEELGTTLGEAVGYKVRFTDTSSDDTLVKLMTDGILLAEIQRDRMLRDYDTLIIDEAHERSLNIDFILGYLKRLLPRRPDLKVIITSATIDPERFSRHFDGAPIIEVSGRTYPVEVRYRPLAAEELVDDDDDANAVTDDRDQIQGICDAVDELCVEGPGDILVFLSGEREIRDTAEALGKHLARRYPEGSPQAVDILPLYARLSAAEQQRVFRPHSRRRVVLATNVAETSLTVPGIRYVVDPGTARISRYSHRTKVQRLPIERISQASANQRKGRCGRVAEGVCIRLYSEEDFLSRPEFTDPEILRTNLASVILQMAALGLGDIAEFPFVDGPDRRQVKDGVALLTELGALQPAEDGRTRLTPLGRRLAQLPVDPRLGRMVLEAERNGCVHEVMVITAALSIQDPRERPVDQQQAAAQKHARFAEPESDFLAYLNLWNHLRERQQELSGNQFRKMCREEFLNYLRVREWQDIYSQLRQIVRSLGIDVNTAPADPKRIHLSLLAGLLSHIGLKDPEKHEYLGARGARFAIFPGSALFKKQPRWVMSAELVETSRLWARVNARIEPEWVEELAGHLVKRTYSEPHWEKRRGAVMAYERVTLYGVPIVTQRRVDYGRIDPAVARELFIRHALVQGEWDTRHAFFHANRKLLKEVEDLEHRARRRDILVDDEVLFDFYDQRVGAEVVSVRHFDSWWKRVRRERPNLLDFDRSMLVNDAAGEVTEEDYPDFWQQGEHRFRLTYQFEPGDAADGVTVHLPLKVLNQVSADGFDWQIPGLREELVTALMRSLPKAIRRSFVPVPDHAAAVLKRLKPRSEPLLEALSRELTAMGGPRVTVDDWQLDRVPDHLRMTFRAVDEKGRTLAEAKDLEELRRRLQPRLREAISAEAAEIERTGLTAWDFGPLPRTFERRTAGHLVKGYPALVDEGTSVGVRIFDNEPAQRQAMAAGTRRLLMLTVPSPVKFLQGHLSNQSKLVFSRSPHGSVAALFDDCVACGVDALVAEAGGPVWDPESFAKLREHVRVNLVERVMDILAAVERILVAAQRLEKQLKSATSLAVLPSVTDIQNQLGALVGPGFVTAVGHRRLRDLTRYLKAIEVRLARLPHNPRRDQVNMAKVEQMRQAYQRLLDRLPPGVPPGPEHENIRWMLEELRISYFAQEVGTAHSVSDKRILKAISEVQAGGSG